MSQKILHMVTNGISLRSKADSWSAEDSSLYRFGKPVGLTPNIKDFYCFENPLLAMACDWCLMGSPREDKEYSDDKKTYYHWWFTKG